MSELKEMALEIAKEVQNSHHKIMILIRNIHEDAEEIARLRGALRDIKDKLLDTGEFDTSWFDDALGESKS